MKLTKEKKKMLYDLGITKNQLSGILERSHIVRIKISIRLWYVPEGK